MIKSNGQYHSIVFTPTNAIPPNTPKLTTLDQKSFSVSQDSMASTVVGGRVDFVLSNIVVNFSRGNAKHKWTSP